MDKAIINFTINYLERKHGITIRKEQMAPAIQQARRILKSIDHRKRGENVLDQNSSEYDSMLKYAARHVRRASHTLGSDNSIA